MFKALLYEERLEFMFPIAARTAKPDSNLFGTCSGEDTKHRRRLPKILSIKNEERLPLFIAKINRRFLGRVRLGFKVESSTLRSCFLIQAISIPWRNLLSIIMSLFVTAIKMIRNVFLNIGSSAGYSS